MFCAFDITYTPYVFKQLHSICGQWKIRWSVEDYDWVVTVDMFICP